jgi:hypothetical protein
MAPHSPYESTPRVRPSGAASHLDLFEQPAADCGAGVTGAAVILGQPVTATSRGLPSKIGLSVVSISA